MPKKQLAPLPPEDVPFWDALVDERGDPRPYEAGDIGVVVVIDEPCLDRDGFVEAFRQLGDAVAAAKLAFETLITECGAVLEELTEEFRERHGIVGSWIEPPVTHGEQTIIAPAIGELQQLHAVEPQE